MTLETRLRCDRCGDLAEPNSTESRGWCWYKDGDANSPVRGSSVERHLCESCWSQFKAWEQGVPQDGFPLESSPSTDHGTTGPETGSDATDDAERSGSMAAEQLPAINMRWRLG